MVIFDTHAHKKGKNYITQYTISQLRIVRSGLHLVTYLDVGNFCDKTTEITLHEICVQDFLKFFDSSKSSQSVSLIYDLAWLTGIRKSEENYLKTACKVAPVTKVAHIFWWRQDNRKQSASAREHGCDITCDIPYWSWTTSIGMIWWCIVSTHTVQLWHTTYCKDCNYYISVAVFW